MLWALALVVVALLAGEAWGATPTSLDAEWTAPTTNDCSTFVPTPEVPTCDPVLTDLAGYRLYMVAAANPAEPCPTLSFVYVPSPVITPAPGTIVRTTVTGLTPSTTYKSQVAARDLDGHESGCSPVVLGTTLAAAPPSNVTNLQLRFAKEAPVALSVPTFEQIGDGGITEVDSATGAGLVAQAGDLIATFTRVHNVSSHTVAIADDVNGAHTQAATLIVPNTGTNGKIFAHYRQNSAGDPDLDVTVNPGGALAFIESVAAVIRGAQTAGGPVGLSTVTAGTTTRTVTIGGLPLGDYIIVGIIHTPSTGPGSEDGSQTVLFDRALTDYYTNVSYRIFTGVTSVSLAWTLPADPGATIGVIAYAFPVAPGPHVNASFRVHARPRAFAPGLAR